MCPFADNRIQHWLIVHKPEVYQLGLPLLVRPTGGMFQIGIVLRTLASLHPVQHVVALLTGREIVQCADASVLNFRDGHAFTLRAFL